MSALIEDLSSRGITLEPKLTFKSATPLDAEVLSLLQSHKHELLQALVAGEVIPRLPWQLEALLRAASSDLLPRGMARLESGVVFDLASYSLANAASYLVSDRDEALKRLWHAHRAWQGSN